MPLYVDETNNKKMKHGLFGIRARRAAKKDEEDSHKTYQAISVAGNSQPHNPQNEYSENFINAMKMPQNIDNDISEDDYYEEIFQEDYSDEDFSDENEFSYDEFGYGKEADDFDYEDEPDMPDIIEPEFFEPENELADETESLDDTIIEEEFEESAPDEEDISKSENPSIEYSNSKATEKRRKHKKRDVSISDSRSEDSEKFTKTDDVRPVIKPQKSYYKYILKAFKYIAVIAVVVLLAYGFKQAYISEFTDEEEQISSEKIKIPNVDGYEIDSAISMLDDKGIEYSIKYVDDELYIYDCVIKTEPSNGEKINVGDDVKVYVAKTPKNAEHGIVETEETPFEKDHINVISFSADNGFYTMLVQNNSNVTIKALSCTLQYQNKQGERYGLRTYYTDGIELKPGDTYTIYGPIKQVGDTYLSIKGFHGYV